MESTKKPKRTDHINIYNINKKGEDIALKKKLQNLRKHLLKKLKDVINKKN